MNIVPVRGKCVYRKDLIVQNWEPISGRLWLKHPLNESIGVHPPFQVDFDHTVNSNLGPVVQSAVSLTSSLRVISLTVLVDSIYNILIFFAEKMWVAFALQHFCVSLDVNFNESLTNDIVSFEQLGPDDLRKNLRFTDRK